MDNSSRVVASVEYSKLWMQQFATEMGTSVEAVLGHAEAWLNGGEYWDEGHEFLNQQTPDEFWTHYKNLTGKEGKGDFITCTC